MNTNKKSYGGNVFSMLSSEIRWKIIQILSENSLTFSELARHLDISSSKLNFHLKKLDKVFIDKKGDRYCLTENGKMFYAVLRNFGSLNKSEDQVKIASIGIMLEADDASINVKEALKNIDIIASQEIDFICLPFLNISQPIPVEKVSTRLKEKAIDVGAYITFGLFESSEGKKYYSTILIKPDGDMEIYRCSHKNLLLSPEVDIGNELKVTDTPFGKIGLICGNEYVYPEIFRVLRLKAADYVVCPAFGIQTKFKKIIQSILVTRAIENQLIVAFSSSSFFQREPFAIVCSPYDPIPIVNDGETLNVVNVGLNEIRKGRGYFEKFFPRRTDLYSELVKKEKPKTGKKPSLPTTLMFPMRKVIKRYRIQNENFVQFEEVTVLEKPLHVNIPMTGYLKGAIPLKNAEEIKWFDDFGALDGVIIKTQPVIEFLTPNRLTLIPGRYYSTGFRCRSSDPITLRGSKIYINFSFEDFNQFLLYGYEVEEFLVELTIGAKFKFINAKPAYCCCSKSQSGETLKWNWIKPQKPLDPIKIELLLNT